MTKIIQLFLILLCTSLYSSAQSFTKEFLKEGTSGAEVYSDISSIQEINGERYFIEFSNSQMTTYKIVLGAKENESSINVDERSFFRAIADVNEDGLDDIITSRSIHLNDGNSTFGEAVTFSNFELDDERFIKAVGHLTSSFSDFVVESPNWMEIYYMNDDLSYNERSLYEWINNRAMQIVDINADGLNDIVYLEGAVFNSLVVQENEGYGPPNSCPEYEKETYSLDDMQWYLFRSDFISDEEYPDIFVMSEENGLWIFKNGWTGFSNPQKILEELTVVNFVFGDFNDDSDQDLAMIVRIGENNPSYNLSISLGNGNGTFEAPTIIDNFDSFFYGSGNNDFEAVKDILSVIDYDKDGDLDILFNDIEDQSLVLYVNDLYLPVDNDGDGFNSDDDCDDNNPDVYPGAPELANNGIDEDCNGEDWILSNTDNLNGIKVDIYPNPANGDLFIEMSEISSIQYQILDLTGKRIMISHANASKVSINTIEFTKGMYLLEIKDQEGNRLIEKIVIK